MHVDLCIQLADENEMTPEDLADKVFKFQQDLGAQVTFSAEVTPVGEGAKFTAALIKRQAEGTTLWAPDPPADVAG